jgi:hypothetical protein
VRGRGTLLLEEEILDKLGCDDIGGGTQVAMLLEQSLRVLDSIIESALES